MRMQLSLLLLVAACWAIEASVRPSYASRQMLQETCPIQFCKSGRDCVYASRTKKWTCKACDAPRIPNTARNECVCPAGMFPTAGGGCSDCKMNMFCPKGQSALRSTAQSCPANMVTLKRGAKSINECFNAPGYYYRKTSGGVRAVPCPVDTWTTGLKKQTVCTACLTGFKTDPETVPGSFTSSDVCVAPAGSFVTGTTVTLCPKGEYSDEYSMATSCQTCEDKYGPGITTPREGSTNVSACFHLEPGFALVNDKDRVFLNPIDLINTPYVGAKACPQNYYCPGGDPTLASGAQGSGTPVKCPHNMWTEGEGAKSEDECVAPPGMYLPDGDLTASAKNIKDCPQGTYKETWQRIGISGCQPCGVGLWLSDKTIFLNDLDPNTGLVRRQIGVRGSSDSCYIQRGMGAVQERNQTSGEVVLRALVCPANYYGVVGVPVVEDSITYYKKYGKVASPCTQCPTNMITNGDDDGSSNTRVTNIMIIKPSDTYQQELVSSPVALADAGYYSVEACFNKPGYGYTQGASQMCALGYFNAGYNKLPCTQCPYGTTTLSSSTINNDVANCTRYIAGFGDLTDIPQLCPVGTYSVIDTLIGQACTSCPVSKTTADVGSDSAADCDVCAAGYGQIALNTTCQSCQDGYYGPNDREDNKCLRCPTGRTFSYDYQGQDDIFVPETTSKPYSDSQADCVADFSQTVDGAFYLDLVPTTGVFDKVPNAENLQSCVQNCREDADCTAATFDYAALQCWAWTPVSTESFVANGGVAFKLVSSTNLAASEGGLAAKEMGSGEFNFIPDGQNVPKAIKSDTIVAKAGITSLKACQKACSDVNLCSGIVFGQFTDPDTIASCSLIMGVSMPGSSLRTLIKANFQGLNTNLKVSAGYYSQPGTSTVSICPEAEALTSSTESYYCPGGPAPGAAPRVRCAVDAYTGVYNPEGAEVSADCNSYLLAGYYYNGSSVVACPDDHYCPGRIRWEGQAAGTGATACPAGTQIASSTNNNEINDCNVLRAGWYYDGSGAISSTSVKQCEAGYYCDSEGIAISSLTSAAGRAACPVGSNSLPFISDINDCNILKAGFAYDSAASSNAVDETSIITCPDDRYCPDRTIASLTADDFGTWCPEGTGIAKQGTDTAAGISTANGCTKLYPGYYYTGVGAGDISITTVLACPADKFCPGAAAISRGTPILPVACTRGTGSNAGTVRTTDTFQTTLISGVKRGNGAISADECLKLKAGYYYDASASAITTGTIKQCPADSYCNTQDLAIDISTPTATAANAAGGFNACPAGVGSLVGSDELTDCNILKVTFYYTGAGLTPVAATNIMACDVKSWCPGGATVAWTTAGSPVGINACPTGTTSAASSDALADCSDLLENYYYTGVGAFSNDNVLLCPANTYCLGNITITEDTDGPAQGIIACPTGSLTQPIGAADVLGSNALDDCKYTAPSYYWAGGASAAFTEADEAYTLCASTGYCPGSILVSSSNLTITYGITSCPGNRPTCTVNLSAGVTCTSIDQCV